MMWAILLLGPLRWAPGAEEPLIEEDSERPAGVEGTVRLSDGTVLRGRVSLPEGSKLRIFDARLQRPFYLEIAQIAAIRTIVEREGMEEAWTFEEEGFRKTLMLGWKYPLRNYGQEVELRGGNLVVGHVYAATVWLSDGKTERRLRLPRQDKGGRGQTLSDLIFVQSIDLAGGESAPREFAAISGRVEGLLAAAAIDLAMLRSVPAERPPKADSAGGTKSGPPGLRIGGLLPGRHSLFLRTEGEVRIGFPASLDLKPAERASVEKRVASIEEFFDEKRIVLLAGDRKRLWALLEMTRSTGTTFSDATGSSYRFRRWEAWVLRADGKGEDGDPWHIESRLFLGRAVVPAAGKLPECSFRNDPALENLDLKPGENVLTSNGRKGIPPKG